MVTYIPARKNPKNREAIEKKISKKRQPRQFYEFDPHDDSFIYCEECELYVKDGCRTHPFIIVPNSVPLIRSLMGEPVCVAIRRSEVNRTKLGAFAASPMPNGVRFGPLEEKDEACQSDGRVFTCSSKWMRTVQYSNDEAKRNVDFFYYWGRLFFRTIKGIKMGKELVAGVDAYPEVLLKSKKRLPATDGRAPADKKEPITTPYPSWPPKVGAGALHWPDARRTHKNPFQCSRCGKELPYSCEEYLRLHMLENSGETRRRSCRRCIIKFGKEVRPSTQTREKEGRWKCRTCLLFFPTNAMLMEHRKTHLSKCDLCGATFAYAYMLQRHAAREHPKMRAFKCEYCEKWYGQISTLRAHVRMHNSEDQFKCAICDCGFQTRGQMLIHMRLHARSDPSDSRIFDEIFTA